MQQTVADRSKSLLLIEALIIFGLFNLTVARPLFELLARYAEFFVFKRVTRFELLAFTFVISILLPGILISIRFLVLKISPNASRLFLWMLITVFTLAFALPGLNHQNFIDSDLSMIGLVLICGFTSLGYFRFQWLRLFFLYLSPAIVIVPLLFIASPKIWQLMFSKPVEIPNVTIRSQTPIILIVFDEFPLISLLNGEQNIDELRYPNFARVAREWNWYRAATTVAERTQDSLAAILTGNYPKVERLPTTIDYPKNLFTLFAKSYDLNVFETVTWMDPSSIVFEKNDAQLWKSLFSDLGLVYLHVILPPKYSALLQPVTQSWGDFASESEKGKLDRRMNSKNPDVHLQKFFDSVRVTKRPGLHFIHVHAPHKPWYLLPSGKKHGSQTYDGMNLVFSKWVDDEAAVKRAYLRHLMQVGYVDHWIGEFFKKLQKSGLYDQSIIVITADHGISFGAGKFMRTVSKQNAEELIVVPLFMKAPHQKTGRTLDWNVQTIDILPTIAELAGVQVPWKLDGTSVAISQPPNRTRYVCGEGCKTRHQFDSSFKLSDELIQRKLNWFGVGETPENMSAPCRNIIGSKIQNGKKNANGWTVRLRNKELFESVSPQSDLIPVFVAGQVHIPDGIAKQIMLGISVNGVFQATTLSSPLYPKTHNFDALIPEASLLPGKNDVQIYFLPTCDGPLQIAQE